ncbi:MAG: carboxypeptidase-like regulatory domain-containing protein [Candidatus Syntrophosphaera sp.]|nr:carboxypeptidase-like regulatory domain-containing protein [Candidatus Syntrophosphaera sp.]
MKILRILLVLVLLGFSFSHGAHTNLDILRTIKLLGEVTDVYGTPLEGAEIRIVNIDNLPATTDEDGFYQMYRGFNSGILIVRVSKPGYRTKVKPNIIVHSDGPREFTVNCTLEVDP